MRFGLAHEAAEVGGVAAAHLRGLAARFEAVARVLVDGLQEAEARLVVRALAPRQQALLHQRAEAVEQVGRRVIAGPAHGLGGFERAAADEDGQATNSVWSAASSRS